MKIKALNFCYVGLSALVFGATAGGKNWNCQLEIFIKAPAKNRTTPSKKNPLFQRDFSSSVGGQSLSESSVGFFPQLADRRPQLRAILHP